MSRMAAALAAARLWLLGAAIAAHAGSAGAQGWAAPVEARGVARQLLLPAVRRGRAAPGGRSEGLPARRSPSFGAASRRLPSLLAGADPPVPAGWPEWPVIEPPSMDEPFPDTESTTVAMPDVLEEELKQPPPPAPVTVIPLSVDSAERVAATSTPEPVSAVPGVSDVTAPPPLEQDLFSSTTLFTTSGAPTETPRSTILRPFALVNPAASGRTFLRETTFPPVPTVTMVTTPAPKPTTTVSPLASTTKVFFSWPRLPGAPAGAPGPALATTTRPWATTTNEMQERMVRALVGAVIEPTSPEPTGVPAEVVVARALARPPQVPPEIATAIAGGRPVVEH